MRFEPPVRVVSAAVDPPVNEIAPSSDTVNDGVPPDCNWNGVPVVPAAVSFNTNPVAVPAFVIVNEVGVPRPPASVNAISLAVVVVIVFPRS